MDNRNVLIHISSGTIARIILSILLVFLLYFLRDIAMVVLTSIVIASAIEPATAWFERHKFPRIPAVIVMYALIIAVLGSIFYFLLPPLLSETASLLTNLERIEIPASLKDSISGTGDFIGIFGSQGGLKEVVLQIQQLLTGVSGGFFKSISVIFGGVLSFVLIIVLSFYFAVQRDGVSEFLRVIVPVKHEQYVIDLWKRSQQKIGYWMQGQLLLGVLVGVLVYLGLTILGVKHSLLLAVLAAIFEIIPLFGPVLAAIPGVGLAFIDGGISLALLVFGLYLIIQQFENHLIYPLVVNKVVGVSPIIVIIALLIGAKLAGFLGILLSVPVSAALMEYYNDLIKNKRAVADHPVFEKTL